MKSFNKEQFNKKLSAFVQDLGKKVLVRLIVEALKAICENLFA